jgi:hypothetical protein
MWAAKTRVTHPYGRPLRNSSLARVATGFAIKSDECAILITLPILGITFMESAV